ncbi:MAG TPA: hypothetical protein VGD17_06750, partial [Chitinophagaceae bacterium]
LPYLLGEKQWDGPQIKEFNYEDAVPLLKEAKARFDCAKCEEGVKRILTDKYNISRIHLLYR